MSLKSFTASVLCVFVSGIINGETLWYTFDTTKEKYLWSDCGNGTSYGWNSRNGYVNRLPETNDEVGLNSTNNHPEKPLIVDLEEVKINELCIGDSPAAQDGRKVALRMDEGSSMYVNWQADLGVLPGSCANVYIAGGTLRGQYLIVGNEGFAVVTNDAGTIGFNQMLHIGKKAGAEGILVHNSGEVRIARHAYIGYKGRGFADIKDYMYSGYLNVGGNPTGGPSVMNVHEGVSNVVHQKCYIGGYTVDSTVDDVVTTTQMSGNGEMNLLGGDLVFDSLSKEESTPPRLFVNTSTNENNELVGYGKLGGYGKAGYNKDGSDGKKIRMVMNGIVEANGYGADRELFLGHIVNSQTTVSLDWTTANGWYAVNKGILTYPRTWVGGGVSSKTFIFGDKYDSAVPVNDKLKLVNSILVTINRDPDNSSTKEEGTSFCSLYAKDCDMIPSGLPDDKNYVGIWSFNFYQNCEKFEEAWATDRPFKNMDITFRYDHTKVNKDRDNLYLYKYTNESGDWKWVRLGKYKAAALSAPLISVTAQPRLRNATKHTGMSWNANGGWYALLAGAESGTMIIVR